MKRLLFALITLFGFTVASAQIQRPVTKTETTVDFENKEINKKTTVVKPTTTVDFKKKRIIRRTPKMIEPEAKLEKKKYTTHKKKYLKYKKHNHKKHHHKNKKYKNHGHKVREVARDK